MCEQKCHLTVWVFRECLKSLYCPQCKRYMSCACGLGFGGGSKILMEKKIPCALGFDTCSPTEEKQNHRNRSQQEDTTELPVSVSLTITPSRFHALWSYEALSQRTATTEPRLQGPCWQRGSVTGRSRRTAAGAQPPLLQPEKSQSSNGGPAQPQTNKRTNY